MALSTDPLADDSTGEKRHEQKCGSWTPDLLLAILGPRLPNRLSNCP